MNKLTVQIIGIITVVPKNILYINQYILYLLGESITNTDVAIVRAVINWHLTRFMNISSNELVVK